PFNHLTIQPSNHPTIQPSNHLTIQPSNHLTIQPSNHPTTDHFLRVSVPILFGIHDPKVSSRHGR
ncbi:MAG TPA: hypothetical protein DCL77_11145, partial [Prolixibacteraceae bacterium]|nr:hypothetical protein [Prolixibacteraceae bacterium]